jgi:hypothetical protein
MPGSSHILVTSFLVFRHLGCVIFLYHVFCWRGKMGKVKWQLVLFSWFLHCFDNCSNSFFVSFKTVSFLQAWFWRTKKLLEQLSKQCRNQEKRTNCHFTLPILPRQQKTWYRKITQPKWRKTKNEVTKICDEPGISFKKKRWMN